MVNPNRERTPTRAASRSGIVSELFLMVVRLEVQFKKQINESNTAQQLIVLCLHFTTLENLHRATYFTFCCDCCCCTYLTWQTWLATACCKLSFLFCQLTLRFLAGTFVVPSHQYERRLCVFSCTTKLSVPREHLCPVPPWLKLPPQSTMCYFPTDTSYISTHLHSNLMTSFFTTSLVIISVGEAALKA